MSSYQQTSSSDRPVRLRAAQRMIVVPTTPPSPLKRLAPPPEDASHRSWAKHTVQPVAWRRLCRRSSRPSPRKRPRATAWCAAHRSCRCNLIRCIGHPQDCSAWYCALARVHGAEGLLGSRSLGLTLLWIPREHIRGICSDRHSITEAPCHPIAQGLHTRRVVSFLTELNVQAET